MPSFFTTAASFYMLFNNKQNRRWRIVGPARRVAYTSASHALWLQKVVDAIASGERQIRGRFAERIPAFSDLAANRFNNMRREGPESFPRILFANSGTKRRTFMEKMALYVTRLAEVRLHDLSTAVNHLSGELRNLSIKQRVDFFYGRNRENERQNERDFNDRLNYKALNTTKIVPVRHKSGQVEMVGPTKGLLSAFSDLDSAPNRRKFQLSYIIAFSRLLLNEILPETLKRGTGGGLIEGGAETISTLKKFFHQRFKSFLRNSIDTLNSQSGDIFFAPHVSSLPIVLDHNNGVEHRLFANKLSSTKPEEEGGMRLGPDDFDLKGRIHHLDW